MFDWVHCRILRLFAAAEACTKLSELAGKIIIFNLLFLFINFIFHGARRRRNKKSTAHIFSGVLNANAKP
jgi:hypothetical protein